MLLLKERFREFQAIHELQQSRGGTGLIGHVHDDDVHIAQQFNMHLKVTMYTRLSRDRSLLTLKIIISYFPMIRRQQNLTHLPLYLDY